MQYLANIMYILFISLIYNSEIASTGETSKIIYRNIQGDKFCFRRLNATHQIGCSSSQGGNVGVIHLVENATDIEWIIRDGPDPPYIAALTIPYYTMTKMKQLISSQRVNGIIVLKEEKIPNSFSPDSSCPNDNFGLYKNASGQYMDYAGCSKLRWNPDNPALNMMYVDWNIPIFLVTNLDDINFIKDKCFKTFNIPQDGKSPSWPLCSAQLISKMSAAKDTATCMRRNKFTSLNHVGYCDPLGDKNIILPLKPINKSENLNNRSVVVVAARLDSFSMFDQLSPGAHSVVPGLITLLTIAKSLGSFKQELYNSKKFKNLIFMVFNGEAFDYIGSSRVVYDMEQGSFPLTLEANVDEQPALVKTEHISHFIEISQMLPTENIWIHTDPVNYGQTNKKLDEFIALLSNFSDNMIKRVDEKQPLPPSSLQRFLRKDIGIAGLVLADHEKEFTNKYYNSLFDNAETLNRTELSSRLAKVANAVSRAIYKLFTDEDIPELEIDEKLISDILECYIVNSSCSIFQQLSGTSTNDLPPYPLYVSVSIGGLRPNAITIFTHHLLANLTGDTIYNISKDDCTSKSKDDSTDLYHYFWISNNSSNGSCIQTTALLTDAISPAFIIKDWNSNEYSTWTESVWTETSARIFLQPSLGQELMTLGIGIFILVLSFALVYEAEKKSPILFGIRQLTSC